MKRLFIILLIIIPIFSTAQENESAELLVKNGVESSELRDLLAFKNIDYFSILISDESILEKKFAVISKEYWDGRVTGIDTVADLSKTPIPGLFNDTLIITILAEKSENDSLRITFNFKQLFSVTKKYQTTTLDTYSTRDLSNGKSTNVNIGESFPLLVYSLPYEKPDYPGWLFYCELTSDGVPPKDWGEKYNLKHYIVFEMVIF